MTEIEFVKIWEGEYLECSFTPAFMASWHPFNDLYYYNGFLTEC